MSNESPSIGKSVKKGGAWLTVLGVLTVLLGVLAISSPAYMGVGVTIFAGVSFLFSGVFQVIHGFTAHESWGGKFFMILAGVLTLIGGCLTLSHPVMGMKILTLVLAAYFLAEGIVGCVFAFKMKPEPGWGWALFGGIVSAILGVIIWRQWPLSGMWAIGTLFGVRLLINGWGMIFFGGAARQLGKAVSEGASAS